MAKIHEIQFRLELRFRPSYDARMDPVVNWEREHIFRRHLSLNAFGPSISAPTAPSSLVTVLSFHFPQLRRCRYTAFVQGGVLHNQQNKQARFADFTHSLSNVCWCGSKMLRHDLVERSSLTSTCDKHETAKFSTT